MRDTGTEDEGVSEQRASARERGVAAGGVGCVGAGGVCGNGKSGTDGNGGKLPALIVAEKSVCGESWIVDDALAEEASPPEVAPLVTATPERAAREDGVGEEILGPARPPK